MTASNAFALALHYRISQMSGGYSATFGRCLQIAPHRVKPILGLYVVIAAVSPPPQMLRGHGHRVRAIKVRLAAGTG